MSKVEEFETSWNNLLEVCEKLVVGSAEKLKRIRDNNEAKFNLTMASERHGGSLSGIICNSFLWGETEESKAGDITYWSHLYEKLDELDL